MHFVIINNIVWITNKFKLKSSVLIVMFFSKNPCENVAFRTMNEWCNRIRDNLERLDGKLYCPIHKNKKLINATVKISGKERNEYVSGFNMGYKPVLKLWCETAIEAYKDYEKNSKEFFKTKPWKKIPDSCYCHKCFEKIKDKDMLIKTWYLGQVDNKLDAKSKLVLIREGHKHVLRMLSYELKKYPVKDDNCKKILQYAPTKQELKKRISWAPLVRE